MSSSTNNTRTSGPITPPAVCIGFPRPMRIEALATFTTELAPAEIPKGEDCSICLESLSPARDSPQEQMQAEQDKTVVRPKVCSHAVHRGCLLRWTEQLANCPLCRKVLFYPMSGPGNRDSLRKFVVPFAGGDYFINESMWMEWANSCDNEEELSWVMDFREVLDEAACWRFVRGE